MGENGAGKSTLVNILSGFIKPDGGHMAFGDRVYRPTNPRAAKAEGIELVHQHFMLVPNLTVKENLVLAQLSSPLGIVDIHTTGQKAIDIAKKLGWSIDADSYVRDLPVGVRQRLEIIKALSSDSGVLILDEPTAVLSPDEVKDLFRVLRHLRDDGKIVILIAHKIAQVMAVADQVTVLRKGVVTGRAEVAEVDAATLAQWMVGEIPRQQSEVGPNIGEVVVRADNILVKGDRDEVAVNEANFEIRAGEILGFGGVDGNGQVELAEALAEVRPLVNGHLSITSRAAYVPQDRQVDALAMDMTIADNLNVPMSTGHPWWLPQRELARLADSLIQRFDIKANSRNDLISSLSGGNQQKVSLARALSGSPRFLVIVNPTRGLDVKATSFVHGVLKQARADGAAIALFSTDLDELSELADRAFFMSAGRLMDANDAISYVGGL